MSLFLDSAFENGYKCRLGNIDMPEFLHSRLAALLFFKHLHLARHIAAVQFRKNILSERTNIFTSDNLLADGGLHRNLELMRRDRFRKGFAHLHSPGARLVAVNHRGECVHSFGIKQNIHLYDIRNLVSGRLVIH